MAKLKNSMETEVRDEILMMMDNNMKSIMTTVQSQNEVINTKLDSINNHLARINGRINRHDEQISEALIERARNREEQREHFKDVDDLKPRVRNLEDTQLTTKAIKKWLVGSVAVTGGLIAIILSLIHLFTNFLD